MSRQIKIQAGRLLLIHSIGKIQLITAAAAESEAERDGTVVCLLYSIDHDQDAPPTVDTS